MSSSKLNKSSSDLDIDDDMEIDKTPPNYISVRPKNTKEDKLLSEFNKFKEDMKELFSTFINTQKSELTTITSNLKDIQHTNSKIEMSVENLSRQNDEFQKKIQSLELQAKKDREYITLLEERLEDQQRRSQKNCIELKNVPRKDQEKRGDLINMVMCLSKNISVDLDIKDIKDIHRVQGKDKTKDTPIVVELGSTLLKTDILQKAKSYNRKNPTKIQAKHLGFTIKEDNPIFISEQLTAKGNRLYFLARDLAKTKNYKFCWTAFGRVFVKRNENSQAVIIKNEAQVHHLLQEP